MDLSSKVPNTGPIFFTTEEAADFLGFTPAYLRKLCFLRQIPYFKPNGGRLLFDRAELEAYIRASKVSSNDQLAARADAMLNNSPMGPGVRA